MQILGLGLDLKGNPLFKPIDGTAFEQALIDALPHNADHLRATTKTTARGFAFRGEMMKKISDPGDPVATGWTFLIAAKDPARHVLEAVLEPLALHRGMEDPHSPLLFNGEPADDWYEWLTDNYYALELAGKKVPHYILIVGGPDSVPFHFQSLLDTVANVGRVAFDSPDDLKNYVEKLLRLENAPDAIVKREALFFAPDAGPGDPTHFSRQYMALPLADHVQNDLKFPVQKVLGNDATKANLLTSLRGRTPALVYTASHGLGALNEPPETQKRYNGAICCQQKGGLTLDSLFSADDVPINEPFLEGAVFFQFACFGYGTPAESDFSHWLPGVPPNYTDADFVAGLPKRLLAHPRGPIAFVGHLDSAFLHGFTDPEAPESLDRWNNRIEPFLKAVDELLAVEPSGLAMQDMGQHYSICNALITNTYDRERRGKLTWTPERRHKFADSWITRSDAQNYMVFGDPAAHLRIPD